MGGLQVVRYFDNYIYNIYNNPITNDACYYDGVGALLLIFLGSQMYTQSLTSRKLRAQQPDNFCRMA